VASNIWFDENKIDLHEQLGFHNMKKEFWIFDFS
jgi:hypothetical protein